MNLNILDIQEDPSWAGGWVLRLPNGTVSVDRLCQILQSNDAKALAELNGICFDMRMAMEWQKNAEILEGEVTRLKQLLNTPELEDFDKAVPLEAAHQVERWSREHDEEKDPEQWFWVLGYLAGKALAAWRAGDIEKAKHHVITSAAVCRNWHARLRQA